MRRVWICAQLRIKGNSLRKLAQREGVSHQAMSAALMTPNVHLEPVVAGALGLTPQQLFPERFDHTGNRICRTRVPQRSTQIPPGNA
ncbi:MAG: helix-turn-helix domain-containing protein [Rhodospirillaceae bacterium]|nr:helix-turn-helix domain-containing protein [Rhodospirillales bacterium]